MDMGISNITRSIGRTDSDLDLKKPQPVDKTSEARFVSDTEAKSKSAETDKQTDSKKPEALDNAGLTEVASKINELFQNESRSLQFKVDEASGKTVIKILDSQTGEQIKQIPAEELLEISRKLANHLEVDDEKAGVLVKSRA